MLQDSDGRKLPNGPRAWAFHRVFASDRDLRESQSITANPTHGGVAQKRNRPTVFIRIDYPWRSRINIESLEGASNNRDAKNVPA